MNETINGFLSEINALDGNITHFLLISAGIGTLSMALIQTLKDLLPFRKMFHQWWIRRWIRARLTKVTEISSVMTEDYRKHVDGMENIKKLDLTSSTGKIEGELVRLAVDGSHRAFYTLPIEKLTAQVNVASQVCLDYPRDHASLLIILSSGASTEDIIKVISFAPTPGEQTKREERQPNDTSFIDARNRLQHQIQRAIDAIQINVGDLWQQVLQIASIVVSLLLAMAFLSRNDAGNISAISFVSSIFVAVLAGFLAPVARDLMVALQKLRAK